jgi:hypothetical protein
LVPARSLELLDLTAAAVTEIVPFSMNAAVVQVHDCSMDPEIASQVVCNGTAGGCMLCMLKVPLQRFVLVPVYSIRLQKVVVLSLDTEDHLHSRTVMPRIAEAVQLLRTGSRQCVTIVEDDAYIRPLLDDEDDGHDAIGRFRADFAEGVVGGLESVYHIMANEELLSTVLTLYIYYKSPPCLL